MTLEEIDIQLLIYLNSLGSEFWDPLWIVLTNKLTYIPLFAFIFYYIYRRFGLKQTAFIIPKKVIGKSTNSNLQSGIMLGAIDVVDGMCQRIIKETGWQHYNVIITGGFGKIISPHLRTKHILLSNLTLDGIRLTYENK